MTDHGECGYDDGEHDSADRDRGREYEGSLRFVEAPNGIGVKKQTYSEHDEDPEYCYERAANDLHGAGL
ncbi:hypothetical protein [Subtercola boreus]|uniref:hypothetical protein n=1 Tax=Subtercola boreus TaxID=120213 RepID=UPI0011C06FA2|nr:hypothetical protein [Subtercola boreus]